MFVLTIIKKKGKINKFVKLLIGEMEVSYMKRIIIVILLGIFLVSSCGRSPSQYGVKDPLEIKMTFKESKYSKDENIKLDIHFKFMDKQTKSAKVLIETDEIIKIKDEKEYSYSDVNEIDDKTITVELSKPFDINGYGEIRAHLYTYDDSGVSLYYQSTSVYYHISDEGILLGINGIYELRAKHLDNLLEAGKINEQQHKNFLHELSRGDLKIPLSDGGGE